MSGIVWFVFIAVVCVFISFFSGIVISLVFGKLKIRPFVFVISIGLMLLFIGLSIVYRSDTGYIIVFVMQLVETSLLISELRVIKKEYKKCAFVKDKMDLVYGMFYANFCNVLLIFYFGAIVKWQRCKTACKILKLQE